MRATLIFTAFLVAAAMALPFPSPQEEQPEEVIMEAPRQKREPQYWDRRNNWGRDRDWDRGDRGRGWGRGRDNIKSCWDCTRICADGVRQCRQSYDRYQRANVYSCECKVCTTSLLRTTCW